MDVYVDKLHANDMGRWAYIYIYISLYYIILHYVILYNIMLYTC